MAEVNLSYEQCVEKLLEWYYDMRVDHLETHELVFELMIRNVVIRDDPDFSRRRRSLRQHLKVEKEDNKIMEFEFSGVFEEQIELCKGHYNEILTILTGGGTMSTRDRCRSRLLHFGHKLLQLKKGAQMNPEQQAFCEAWLSKTIDLLRQYFYCDDGASALLDKATTQNNLQPSDEDSESEETRGTTSTDRRVEFVDTDSDLVRMLKHRIAELSCQLRMKRNMCEVSTQTDPTALSSFKNSYWNMDNSTLPEITNRFSYLNTKSVATPAEHSYSFPTFNAFTSTAGTIPPNAYNYKSQHQEATSRPYNREPFPSNFAAAGHQPWPQNAYRNSFADSQARFAHRRTLPVSKWSIGKYNGEDQGLKLNQFLEIVQAMSLAEHVSEQELFESAIHLFTGAALQWFMTMRGRLINWQHLVAELRHTFMHPDLDALIKVKIYQRRQQRNESFYEYYHEIEQLFRTMSFQLPEQEKVQVLQQNMRLDYKKQLNFLPIFDLASLIAAGQKVDALNFSAYSKVFGNEKSVTMIDDERNRKSQRNSTPIAKSQPARSSITQPHSEFPRSASCLTNSPNRDHPRGQPLLSKPANKSKRSPIPLDALIDAHQPPPNSTCFNCGRQGHRITQCTLPRGVLCEKCGFRGYPTNNCPYCTKNVLSASENRRSLDH